jgi:hypothetical protein
MLAQLEYVLKGAKLEGWKEQGGDRLLKILRLESGCLRVCESTAIDVGLEYALALLSKTISGWLGTAA